MKAGLYNVLQYEGDTEPVIARLTKNSGWQFEDNAHHKMIRCRPYLILNEVLDGK